MTARCDVMLFCLHEGCRVMRRLISWTQPGQLGERGPSPPNPNRTTGRYPKQTSGKSSRTHHQPVRSKLHPAPTASRPARARAQQGPAKSDEASPQAAAGGIHR